MHEDHDETCQCTICYDWHDLGLGSMHWCPTVSIPVSRGGGGRALHFRVEEPWDTAPANVVPNPTFEIGMALWPSGPILYFPNLEFDRISSLS